MEGVFNSAAKRAAQVEQWLLPAEAGFLEPEGLERTDRLQQRDLVSDSTATTTLCSTIAVVVVVAVVVSVVVVTGLHAGHEHARKDSEPEATSTGSILHQVLTGR